MREVDKQNKAKKNENRGSNERDVVSPEHEETVRDEEGNSNEEDPQKDLRTPPSEQVVSGVRSKGTFGRTRSE